MAEASFSVQESFICPVCLDLLKDPVAIPCGHSYCMNCIKGCWDQDDQRGVYSCPQCRQTFTQRPVLSKNITLAELAEKLRKTGLQAAPPAVCYAGPGDVECDSCTGRKLKAVKSCLVCLASFCETHLQPHYESPTYKKHKLVEASTQLQDRICSQHDKVVEIYCRYDQKLICYLCTMDEHKGHDTVSAAAERTEKQRQLLDTKRKFQQRIQEREKELQELKQTVKSLRISAQTAVGDSERIFTEIIHSIERRRSEVTEQIRAKEKTELSLAEDHIKKVEQEIAELRKRDTELEQLSHTEDHIHFLQSFQSVSVHSGYKESPNETVNPDLSFEYVRKSVSEMKEKIEKFLSEETVKIPEKDIHQLTLDLNRAHRDIPLPKGNRKEELTQRQLPQRRQEHDNLLKEGSLAFRFAESRRQRQEAMEKLRETQRQLPQRRQEHDNPLKEGSLAFRFAALAERGRQRQEATEQLREIQRQLQQRRQEHDNPLKEGSLASRRQLEEFQFQQVSRREK